MAMIHLDARRPGVIVPTNLKGEPHLLLNLSHRFDPPDLTVGEWGIRSTLTFAGSRFTVAVPWSALYAISSHVTKEFWMYPDDMPKELLQSTPKAPSPLANSGLESAPGPDEQTRGILREVADGAADGAETNPPEKAPRKEGSDPPKRGHLRLIK